MDGTNPVESSSKNVTIEGREVTEKSPPPTAEALIAEMNAIGDALRALIVLSKRLPRDGATEAHQDPIRALALAQANLQTGFMWLRRAIERPKVF